MLVAVWFLGCVYDSWLRGLFVRGVWVWVWVPSGFVWWGVLGVRVVLGMGGFWGVSGCGLLRHVTFGVVLGCVVGLLFIMGSYDRWVGGCVVWFWVGWA